MQTQEEIALKAVLQQTELNRRSEELNFLRRVKTENLADQHLLERMILNLEYKVTSLSGERVSFMDFVNKYEALKIRQQEDLDSLTD